MDNLTSTQINDFSLKLQKLFDIIDSLNEHSTEITNNIKLNNVENSEKQNAEAITPLFELQSTLSDYEKKQRSNFIKEEIKLTAIKGDIVEETMDEFVFISYKSGDWEEVYKKYIAPLHKKYGLNVYCDDAFDGGHENWTIQMEKHITSKKCKAILCFLSKGYLGSYATLLELMSNRFNEYFAKNSSYKPIIPIILDDNNDWDKKLSESNSLVGIQNSGPEYTMFINLLKNFLIILDFENKNINSMNKAFIKKNISEMILDKNINATLTESKTYEFIISTIKLTNNPEYKYYNKINPEQFFEDLFQTIKTSTNGNEAIFSGDKNPNFNVNKFIEKNIQSEYSTSNRVFDYYISDNAEFDFPTKAGKESEECDIKIIGEGAFERKILKTIMFDEDCKVVKINDDAFSDCKYLENISLPKSVKYLGDAVFKNCSSLTELTLPSDIEKIGESTFVGCSSLEKIEILSNLKSIPSKTFKDCISLNNVTIPNTVTSMGEKAFSGCTNLKNIELSFELTVIPKNTFENCTSLNDIYISSSVLEIEESAFLNCTGLTEIYIHQCVKKIQINAFANCKNLSKIDGINLENFTYDELKLAFGCTTWFENLKSESCNNTIL